MRIVDGRIIFLTVLMWSSFKRGLRSVGSQDFADKRCEDLMVARPSLLHLLPKSLASSWFRTATTILRRGLLLGNTARQVWLQHNRTRRVHFLRGFTIYGLSR